mmetsp:Transcript_4204/g.16419  ORF Transcript_4204/g.16419 Transcript_4204/m.16419 type:complete len:260 (-) Transcript_4204:151-930(-)
MCIASLGYRSQLSVASVRKCCRSCSVFAPLTSAQNCSTSASMTWHASTVVGPTDRAWASWTSGALRVKSAAFSSSMRRKIRTQLSRWAARLPGASLHFLAKKLRRRCCMRRCRGLRGGSSPAASTAEGASSCTAPPASSWTSSELERYRVGYAGFEGPSAAGALRKSLRTSRMSLDKSWLASSAAAVICLPRRRSCSRRSSSLAASAGSVVSLCANSGSALRPKNFLKFVNIAWTAPASLRARARQLRPARRPWPTKPS